MRFRPLLVGTPEHFLTGGVLIRSRVNIRRPRLAMVNADELADLKGLFLTPRSVGMFLYAEVSIKQSNNWLTIFFSVKTNTS